MELAVKGGQCSINMYWLAFCLLADAAQSVRANRHILSYTGILQ